MDVFGFVKAKNPDELVTLLNEGVNSKQFFRVREIVYDTYTDEHVAYVELNHTGKS